MTEEFDWLTLEPDEEVVWSDQPHAWSLAPAMLVGVPLTIVLIGALIIASAVLRRENTTYVVTTDGLYKKTGILSRDVQKIEFEKVQNISFSQGPLGKQVGYGNVDISTAGGSGVEMQFRAVADPKDVQETINRLIRQRRGRSGDGDAEGRTTADVLDDILAELQAIRTAVDGGSTALDGPASAPDSGADDGE